MQWSPNRILVSNSAIGYCSPLATSFGWRLKRIFLALDAVFARAQAGMLLEVAAKERLTLEVELDTDLLDAIAAVLQAFFDFEYHKDIDHLGGCLTRNLFHHSREILRIET